MLKNKRTIIETIIAVGGLFSLVVGSWAGSTFLILLGAVGLAYFAYRVGTWNRKKLLNPGPVVESESEDVGDESDEHEQPAACPAPPRAERRAKSDINDTTDLVSEMLAQNRYALLLRAQVAENLLPEQLDRAQAALDDAMSLVPHGEVLMLPSDEDEVYDEQSSEGELILVEPLFLDRYPVTNKQFHEFVWAGGYEQMSFWDPEIWPGVIDFVDQTDHPGPRGWSDGMYPNNRDDHPVVGVSWYEAVAYARWVGKRLPSDPEWVKAAAWPVSVDGKKPLQKRFPWGNSFEPNRANVWSTGKKDTVPVHEFEEGASPGGVYGLTGNVWEWTSTNYGDWDNRRFEMSAPFKSVRGGAFDSYFESHATCHFQSGDVPVARKYNIGFRCAVGLCDVVSGFNVENEDDEVLATHAVAT